MQKRALKHFKMQSFKGKPQNKDDDLSFCLDIIFFSNVSTLCLKFEKNVFKCVENKVQFNVQN